MNERVARQPEDWLRLAEGALHIGFWTWTVADARLTCSPGFFDLVGVNPAGVQLDPGFIEQLVHPKDRLAVDDANKLAIDSRQADRRFRIIRPDGQLRCLRSQARSFFDRDGVVTRVVAVVSDISESHALQRRTGHLTGLIYNLARLMNAAFWIADEDGRLIERFSADEHNDLKKTGGSINWRDVVHPDDVARTPAAWRDAVANKRSFRFDGRMLMSDGEYRALHAAGLPFLPEHSSDPYWGGFSAAEIHYVSPATALGESALRTLTSGQLRACRALLNWTAETLAAKAGISVSTIRRLEGNEMSQGQGDSMRLVMLAFREAGLKIWRGEDGRFCVSDSNSG
ncbi:PAS domain-containing protein [Devosia rhizoryzae]|uniref:histidine kinase n=1 Tax=Devosia rhizoryzae TaxID=2774137 RepID=A0ABX7CAW6_9HYPH|nr:PAS domain-containing protein [Devosia rhizoryzae]QQR40344.1 PAS domain-containing protein [Devosia rhizoryzae]